MNFIDRARCSWELFKITLRVISANKRLLLFPLVTSAATLVLVAFFLAVPILAFVAQPTGHSYFTAAHWQAIFGSVQNIDALVQRMEAPENKVILSVTATLYTVAIYFTSMFVATFCNVAFYNEIMRALAGQPPSIRSGVAFAMQRIQSILFWSLFAGLVGYLIKTISERLGFIGNILMRFVGVAWSVASVFVIPIIIRENNQNPIQLLKSSAAMLKKTWGESLIGYVGIGSISILIALGVVASIFASLITGALLDSPALLFTGVTLSILFAIVAGLVVSVANDIFRCALYIYASEGVVPEPFDADLMNAAWKIKKS